MDERLIPLCKELNIPNPEVDGKDRDWDHIVCVICHGKGSFFSCIAGGSWGMCTRSECGAQMDQWMDLLADRLTPLRPVYAKIDALKERVDECIETFRSCMYEVSNIRALFETVPPEMEKDIVELQESGKNVLLHYDVFTIFADLSRALEIMKDKLYIIM